MIVDILKIGEPVPVPGHPARWGRSGLLAKALLARGHQVRWVVSTFDHMASRHVLNADSVVEVCAGLTMYAFHAPAYTRHRSVARLVHHAVIAPKVSRWYARTPTQPHAIVAALPTPELATIAVSQGRRRGVPVVVDCRDMWPDLFLEHRSLLLRSALKVATFPMLLDTRRACAGATAIAGHTEEFVDWGLRRGRRERSRLDRAFPLGYPSAAPESDLQRAAAEILDSLGVPESRDYLRIIFVGSFTQHFAFDAVIDAARLCWDAGLHAQFVFCGEGDRRASAMEASAGLPNVRFLGWQPAHVIWALLRRADCGLAPYVRSASFEKSIPNKIIEYLSASLPVLSSLNGTTEDLLSRHRVGWNYHPMDASDLVRMIQAIATAEVDLHSARERAGALFAEQFRADVVYDSYARHIESLVGKVEK